MINKQKVKDIMDLLDPLPGHRLKLIDLFAKIETVRISYLTLVALSKSKC